MEEHQLVHFSFLRIIVDVLVVYMNVQYSCGAVCTKQQ